MKLTHKRIQELALEAEALWYPQTNKERKRKEEIYNILENGVVFLSCSGGIIMEFHCDSSLIPEDIK